MTRPAYPDGKRFAFTVIDDTDVATLENVAPVYDLLRRLGMRATKTVWPLGCPEGSRDFSSSETLEDEEYRRFVMELAADGFEITWHGATMESSDRARTAQALERFRELVGHYPRVHANHAYNAENLYWGSDRCDSPLLRGLLRVLDRERGGRYHGHEAGSAYWWGDLCLEHVEYVRNLTFDELDLRRVNPSMPYHDPRRPWVRWWFSATDAEDRDAFVELLDPARLDRLEAEGGVCVVATHFGKEFAPGGRLDPEFRRRMEALAARPGWFPPVGALLDWLRERGGGAAIPAAEWRSMQWRWARDLAVRRVRARLGRRARRPAVPFSHPTPR